MTGQKVTDLTSGLRICRAAHFREFLHLLPTGSPDDQHNGILPLRLLGRVRTHRSATQRVATTSRSGVKACVFW